MNTHFSGSFQPSDVILLLKVLDIETISIKKKEYLIQNKIKHYSELLSEEAPITEQHLRIYLDELGKCSYLIAKAALTIAKAILEDSNGRSPVLISLARAGIPFGVCLNRALKLLGSNPTHYGISIIRDKGIDEAALEFIESSHKDGDFYYVDGWTGKGAIANQLDKSLGNRKKVCTKPKLVVLADPCGKAWLSHTTEDLLIPFGIIGSTISGLISRTVWQDKGYHGCNFYKNNKDDLSIDFINTIDKIMKEIVTAKNIIPQKLLQDDKRNFLAVSCETVLSFLITKYKIKELNNIKPGLAETTRSLLRRVPNIILVKDISNVDIKLVIHLATKRNIKVIEEPNLGVYKTCAII